MTTSPISPRLVKGGIVTMDVDTYVVRSVIALQYNPDSLSRRIGWCCMESNAPKAQPWSTNCVGNWGKSLANYLRAPDFPVRAALPS